MHSLKDKNFQTLFNWKFFFFFSDSCFQNLLQSRNCSFPASDQSSGIRVGPSTRPGWRARSSIGRRPTSSVLWATSASPQGAWTGECPVNRCLHYSLCITITIVGCIKKYCRFLLFLTFIPISIKWLKTVLERTQNSAVSSRTVVSTWISFQLMHSISNF